MNTGGALKALLTRERENGTGARPETEWAQRPLRGWSTGAFTDSKRG
jgi:hypothetical protein